MTDITDRVFTLPATLLPHVGRQALTTVSSEGVLRTGLVLCSVFPGQIRNLLVRARGGFAFCKSLNIENCTLRI